MLRRQQLGQRAKACVDNTDFMAAVNMRTLCSRKLWVCLTSVPAGPAFPAYCCLSPSSLNAWIHTNTLVFILFLHKIPAQSVAHNQLYCCTVNVSLDSFYFTNRNIRQSLIYHERHIISTCNKVPEKKNHFHQKTAAFFVTIIGVHNEHL